MAMVCPQCSTTYEQRLQCPLCGVRLLYHDHRRLRNRPSDGPLHWQQTPWGRILIGLVLAQGLFYGLRHLLTAVLMAAQGEEAITQLWTTASALILLQGVRIFSLLGGAVLAGGGQRHGLVLGAVVGAWNGVLSVLFLPGPAQSLTTVAILGQPILQASVGAVGGWLGAAFWKPLPTEPPGGATPPRKLGLRRHMDLFAGPVAWYRVTTGVILAVIGTLTATIVFEKILDLSHGALATTDDMHDRHPGRYRNELCRTLGRGGRVHSRHRLVLELGRRLVRQSAISSPRQIEAGTRSQSRFTLTHPARPTEMPYFSSTLRTNRSIETEYGTEPKGFHLGGR